MPDFKSRAACLKEMRGHCSGVAMDAAFWDDQAVEDAWKAWVAAGRPKWTTVYTSGRTPAGARVFKLRRKNLEAARGSR